LLKEVVVIVGVLGRILRIDPGFRHRRDSGGVHPKPHDEIQKRHDEKGLKNRADGHWASLYYLSIHVPDLGNHSLGTNVLHPGTDLPVPNGSWRFENPSNFATNCLETSQ